MVVNVKVDGRETKGHSQDSCWVGAMNTNIKQWTPSNEHQAMNNGQSRIEDLIRISEDEKKQTKQNKTMVLFNLTTKQQQQQQQPKTIAIPCNPNKIHFKRERRNARQQQVQHKT